MYLVLGEGHQVGWVERGLPGLGDRWVAMYENHFIGDQATREAMLHDTPEQAAADYAAAYPVPGHGDGLVLGGELLPVGWLAEERVFVRPLHFDCADDVRPLGCRCRCRY
ncbi:hypothetical protein [Kitasatospora sp. NPDC094016]|uniref:hypothetical protein n=1 Tax=Kitasatospora sp. NPDC094016 TaxID=3154986 RepID=UPI003321DF94